MSAGNAGRAVSYLGQVCRSCPFHSLYLHTSPGLPPALQTTGYDVKVFMPETAPDDRKVMMESMGASVVKVPGDKLLDSVAACIETEGRILVHPFDDVDIIRGAFRSTKLSCWFRSSIKVLTPYVGPAQHSMVTTCP